jgi:hypothetical protein
MVITSTTRRNEGPVSTQLTSRGSRRNLPSLNSLYAPDQNEKQQSKRQLSRSLIDEYWQAKWPIRYMANYLFNLQLTLEGVFNQIRGNPLEMMNLTRSPSYDVAIDSIKKEYTATRRLLNMMKFINANDYYQANGFKKFYKILNERSRVEMDEFLSEFARVALANPLERWINEKILFDNRPETSQLPNYTPGQWTNKFPERTTYPENLRNRHYQPFNWRILLDLEENNEPST